MFGFSRRYACLTTKNIGKPSAGKPYTRFDKGGLAFAAMVRLLRHRQTKGMGTDRPNLKRQQPSLSSTQTFPRLPGLDAQPAAGILKPVAFELAFHL
jgi:hypothetical protein